MSVSKSFLKDTETCKKIAEMYIAEEKPTTKELATLFHTTEHNVLAVIQKLLTKEQRTAERVLRLSRTKIGKRNPMFGKNLEKHPNWKGVCSDKKGHFTIKTEEGRVFIHRKVFADALGIKVSELPQFMHVHHIDGNPANNALDNLALVTAQGHNTLHLQYQEKSATPLWESYQHSILH